jgi:hypothetical protein
MISSSHQFLLIVQASCICIRIQQAKGTIPIPFMTKSVTKPKMGGQEWDVQRLDVETGGKRSM